MGLTAPRDGSAPLSAAVDERRGEQREQARGRVLLRLANGGELAGELRDVSPSGFRMAHQSRDLQRDTVVRFHYPGKTGSARVMWNRWSSEGAESGLLIVE